MTVGELRKALERVPDEMLVAIHQTFENTQMLADEAKMVSSNTQGGRQTKIFLIK